MSSFTLIGRGIEIAVCRSSTASDILICDMLKIAGHGTFLRWLVLPVHKMVWDEDGMILWYDIFCFHKVSNAFVIFYHVATCNYNIPVPLDLQKLQAPWPSTTPVPRQAAPRFGDLVPLYLRWLFDLVPWLAEGRAWQCFLHGMGNCSNTWPGVAYKLPKTMKRRTLKKASWLSPDNQEIQIHHDSLVHKRCILQKRDCFSLTEFECVSVESSSNPLGPIAWTVERGWRASAAGLDGQAHREIAPVASWWSTARWLWWKGRMHGTVTTL